MNRPEALGYFGLSLSAEEDEVKDALEWSLFTQKRDALGHVGIPQWLKARLKRVESLREAAAILESEQGSLLFSRIKPVEISDPLAFIRSYEQALSQIKLSISGCRSFGELARGFDVWLDLLENYARSYSTVMSPLIEDFLEDVKLSQSLDTAYFLRQFETAGVSASLIEMVSREKKRIDAWN